MASLLSVHADDYYLQIATMRARKFHRTVMLTPKGNPNHDTGRNTLEAPDCSLETAFTSYGFMSSMWSLG